LCLVEKTVQDGEEAHWPHVGDGGPYSKCDAPHLDCGIGSGRTFAVIARHDEGDFGTGEDAGSLVEGMGLQVARLTHWT
jgi:hypothetical protein